MLTTANQDDYLGRVYAEASQWLRMANQIIWAMGSLFVPLALSPFGFIPENKIPRIILAVSSLGLFSFWIVVSSLYRRSTQQTRDVLMKIEETWGIEEEISLYRRQHPIMSRGIKLMRLQVVAFVILALLWIYVFLVFPL